MPVKGRDYFQGGYDGVQGGPRTPLSRGNRGSCDDGAEESMHLMMVFGEECAFDPTSIAHGGTATGQTIRGMANSPRPGPDKVARQAGLPVVTTRLIR